MALRIVGFIFIDFFSKTSSLKKVCLKLERFRLDTYQELTLELNEGKSCGIHIRKDKIRNA